MIKKKYQLISKTIAINKRARYEYFIEEEIEAGLILQGWEVKSIRAGNVNINGSYVFFRDREIYLFGATIQPLNTMYTNIFYDPIRTRKLLLKKQELEKLSGKVSQNGFTIVALSLYWKRAWSKINIGLAKGKKEHDKRNLIKYREWKIHQARIIKRANN
ncbi:SsrA-binding protein SmpB [Candidatus Profftia sp. (ex Adelges kitamiensis)]|uniref:SsrA-binding protein SmpB n=1 Tax=Candidatus Profftia sp. (ex Adelges kitamiensis) TaxID=2864218 RepID=UPI001CE36265|nr:SsrA-binding protein SmpB [Candidatus Profftia sp. (ex Adelges kitamiensis)]